MSSKIADTLLRARTKPITRPVPDESTVATTAFESASPEADPLEYTRRKLLWERVTRLFSCFSGNFGLNLFLIMWQHDPMMLVPLINVAVIALMGMLGTKSANARLQNHALTCALWGAGGLLLAIPVAAAVARMAPNV